MATKKPRKATKAKASKQIVPVVTKPLVVRGKGRPSLYTDGIANEICDRLSKGESLLSIGSDERMPHESTVRGWAIDNYQGFYTKYARAREIGLEHHAELILKLADEIRPGQRTVSKATGMEVTELDQVERSKLQIDARKWYLSKIAPKRYGERIEHEVSVVKKYRVTLGGDY